MARIVYVNGKFLTQRLTGVQRVAGELLRSLDSLLAETAYSGLQFVVLYPHGTESPAWRVIEGKSVGPASLSGPIWEQLVLPWSARDGLLLNLSGSTPWMGRRQACMLHDAAVFDWPEAYSWAFRRWYQFLFTRLGRRAELLLTPSCFSAKRLAACITGLRLDRLHVLPCAASHILEQIPDLRILEKHKLAPKNFLLTVASNNPSKNLAGLLRAHASWKLRLQYPLVLVGGSNAAVFADIALSPCGDGSQLFLGPVNDAELVALYQQALGFVLPSFYEGFGLPPLEAMQSGCAVAVSNYASLPEVCGEAALYFDPKNEAEIIQTLSLLAMDINGREKLCTQGLSRASMFSWRRSAEILLELLQQY
ncbi:glycosyltransferase involved in cell wall biosynthesis [Inhella inkyongensis]|uniref:Glycosyltransferase involved in cell wall biosynthesis n=1 Tax=Inhella inkyongensis TaxID=392593 RepID=A0A840S7D6_9BURK|nr:glycosyltransferase family 1 protein [Inhella inkyongensis]MBB5204481.1 glycosyltransferase involved in cell wall biosynthesis [Inhella inkyongensis]